MQPCRKNLNLLFLGALFFILIGSLPGCASIGSQKASNSEIRSFLKKMVRAAWYEKFKNTEGRNPRVQLVIDPGVNASGLKEYLHGDFSDKLTLVSSEQARPDFRLKIHSNKSVELEQISDSNIVWNGQAGNAVIGPPKPPILWKGFFIGPQVGASSDISPKGTGSISMSGTPSIVGGRLGYAVAGSSGDWAWIPQFSIDILQQVNTTVGIGTATAPLSGSLGLADYAIDPLKFGWTVFSGNALIYLPIGGGLLQMTGGGAGTLGYEGHAGLGIEYRMFKHLTPYIEILGEYGGAPSFTTGSVTYPVAVGFFNVRAMVGVDWFPWTSRASYYEGGE